MRIALVGASLLLVSGMSAACGGDSPDDASTSEFCDAFKAMTESGEDFDKAQNAIDDLENVGTPDNISDDERKGFDLMVKLAGDADNEEDALKAVEDLNEKEQAQVLAFSSYTLKECGGSLLGDLPSSLPTNFPSSFPTELPSNFPSEIPSNFSDLPSEMTQIPSEYLSMLPSELQSMYSNMPTE